MAGRGGGAWGNARVLQRVYGEGALCRMPLLPTWPASNKLWMWGALSVQSLPCHAYVHTRQR